MDSDFSSLTTIVLDSQVFFLVNHREGQDITFTDPRGRNMGTAGVTGIWGTRLAPPVVKPRQLAQVEISSRKIRAIPQ
jgi:hypothetical protein